MTSNYEIQLISKRSILATIPSSSKNVSGDVISALAKKEQRFLNLLKEFLSLYWNLKLIPKCQNVDAIFPFSMNLQNFYFWIRYIYGT